MNVLIIGLGSIAKKHINALKQLINHPNIYALRSGKNVTDDQNSISNISNINEIDINSLDFIIISNPTATHYDTIKTCVNYDKPMFIEKPIFSEINKHTDQLLETIVLKKLNTYVACNLRFLDCILELKTILTDQRINEVNVYCGSYLPDWRPGQDFRKTYSANKEMGGGVHIDLIHELDYIYWIFGEPITTHKLFSNKSSLQITAYDYANYLWEYDKYNISIILNYYRKTPKRSIEILTEDHTYNINLLENSISKDGIIIFSSEQKIIDTYVPQMSHFINIINHKQSSLNTVDEAYKILKLCMQE